MYPHGICDHKLPALSSFRTFHPSIFLPSINLVDGADIELHYTAISFLRLNRKDTSSIITKQFGGSHQ